MAVSANTYGTVARVEARIGDLVASRAFSTTTTPKLAEVETILDDVALEMNGELRAAGYTIPVANSGSDVEAFGWLRKANSAGAAALVLNIFPSEALNPDNPDALAGRRAGLLAEYRDALSAIREKRMPATMTTGPLTRFVTGSQKDSDGNKKLPVFTRTVTDYPSSRTLVG